MSIKQIINLFLFFLIVQSSILAQDTFSIVAVDSLTGEVGAAGASCVDETMAGTGVIIINDIIPGKGAINSQAALVFANKANAVRRMNLGDSPTEIIEWLENNDVQNNSSVRQYGVVDIDENNHPRAAAFTGTNCFDYKGQRVGTHYAIQGNILSGAAILDSMEARFLRAEGTLADRIMASMQGANVAGADSRCLSEGVSSLSAFIRVAKPNDLLDDFWLEIDVPSTPFRVEPIDVLQEKYDEWKSTISSTRQQTEFYFDVFPNPAQDQLYIKVSAQQHTSPLDVIVYDILGRPVYTQRMNGNALTISMTALGEHGLFIINIVDEQGTVIGQKKVIKSI
ncbi:MAG: DUF1028 domain-containing protein [Bacteroidota bacterium]